MVKAKQAVVKVQLEGDGPAGEHKPQGFYVTVSQEKKLFRSIGADGSWRRYFLQHDDVHQRWTLTRGKKEKLIAWTPDGSPSMPQDSAWELDFEGRLVVVASELRELPPDARREAKAFYEDPVPYTEFRCHDCPRNCKQTRSKDWGFKTLAELYAHVCYFHRESDQYRKLHKKHWKESVAAVLRQREESEEGLLKQFELSMERSGYTLKAETEKPENHKKRMREIGEFLQQPISRDLPSEEAAQEIRGWAKDGKHGRRGHYRTTFRWFAKFVEISAMEEMLNNEAAWQDLPIPEPVPQDSSRLERPCNGTEAQQVSCLEPDCKRAKIAKAEVADDLSSDVEIVDITVPSAPKGPSHTEAASEENLPSVPKGPRSSVSRAADPFRALLGQETQVQAPRQGCSSSATSNPGALASEPPPPHRLAELFDRVANRHAAETIAKWIEAKDLQKQALDPKMKDHVWLWAYTGMRERGTVLGQMRGQYALTSLLVRLLTTARSPHRAPDDLLEVFSAGIHDKMPHEQLSFKKLQDVGFLKNGFHIKRPLRLLDAEHPACVYLAVAGAELGRIFSMWPEMKKAVDAWWGTFVACLVDDKTQLPAWMHGVAFASGFWCNFCVEEAASKIEQLERPVPRWSALDFGNLLKQIKAVAPFSSTVAAGQVSAEQRQRLERSRQAALEKKRQRQGEASAEIPCDAHAQPMGEAAATEPPPPTSEAPTTKPAAQEPPGPRVVTIQEVDEELKLGVLEAPLQGKIVYRSDHKTGTSFHVRLGDATGQVDVKFFQGGFKEHPGLHVGAIVRLSGFKVCELKGKSLDFAPPGRRFYLNCADPDAVNIQILQAPSEGARTQNLPLPLLEAAERPDRTYVNISEAFVADVGDLEFKDTKDGKLALRVICLTQQRQGGKQIRWSLWCETAMNYGHKQLAGQRIAIRGAQTKRFGQERQLAGCFREGGIQLLPDVLQNAGG
eukprot:s417_g4.t1